VFENCVSMVNGGAVYGYYNAHPSFEDCTFRNNSASDYGGAVEFWTNCTPAFSGCTFEDNTSGSGGAIDIYDGSNPTFEDCIVQGSGATTGGAVFCEGNCTPTFTRCTFYGNEAPLSEMRKGLLGRTHTPTGRGAAKAQLSGTGGAIYSMSNSNVTLANSIIAFSSAGEAAAASDGGLVTVSCSDVYGNAGGDWVGCIADQFGTNGNVWCDPQFCDAADGIFTLRDESPLNPAYYWCLQIGAQPVACGLHHLVKADGTGEYPTIQAAVDGAPAFDIIDLADGVYTGAGNRDVSFHGKKITVRSESGDPSGCIVDCQGTSSDKHRGFIFDEQESPEALLEGVTITHGYADLGAGIYVGIDGTAPTIRRCRVTDCTAQYGGGMWVSEATSPTVENCTVCENTAVVGGGILVLGASATITGSTIADNLATTMAPGIFQGNGSTVTIANSIIALNQNGPGVVCGGGGSISLSCTDIYGNAGGDWIDCVASQAGQNGNLGEDPLFCEVAGRDFSLHANSPCAEGNNEACGRIGSEPVVCIPTGVEDAATIPSALFLGSPLPNPFEEGTIIPYGLPSSAGGVAVTLTIYDAVGRRVRTLVDESQRPGLYDVRWDGRTDQGRAVSSGVYFVRLKAGDVVRRQKLVLMH
jgi:predicted outer membrane repeat protein